MRLTRQRRPPIPSARSNIGTPPDLDVRMATWVRFAVMAVAVTGLALAPWSPRAGILGAAAALGSVEAWRRRVIVSDGVVYTRWLRWSEPLLLDALVSVRVDRDWSSFAEELVLYDRVGSECRIRLPGLRGVRPLLECVLGLLETNPGIRREANTVDRLRRRCGQRW